MPRESAAAAAHMPMGSLGQAPIAPHLDLDALARLASLIRGTSILLISLVGEDRQWFRALALSDKAPMAVQIREFAVDEPVPARFAEDGGPMPPEPAGHLVGVWIHAEARI